MNLSRSLLVWPVLRRSRMAGFEVITEVLNQLQSTIDDQVATMARGAALAAFEGPSRLSRSPSVRLATRPQGRIASRGRRDTAAMAAIADKVAAYISAHPGQGAEEIAPGMGVRTKELALPIKKLLAGRRIRREGRRRATKYFAQAVGTTKPKGLPSSAAASRSRRRPVPGRAKRP